MADVLIRNGRLIDGTGNPWRYADVALGGDRVAAVAPPGRLDPAGAAEVVDAAGLVVCPGFIDIQSHSILPFLTDGRSLSKVTQGVTTEIMGELWTPAPFGGLREAPVLRGFGRISPEHDRLARGWGRFRDWLDYQGEQGVSVNFGSFVGGATIREYAMGWAMGAPSRAQLATMRRVLAEAMDDGAFGLATALIYPPNSFSPDEELLALAEVVAEHGGVYISHIRSEADAFLESLRATVELGRQSRAPVEVYHLKVCGERNWPKMAEAVRIIDEARASGVDIAADMYPYIASGTGLGAAMPDWAQADGRLEENLSDPAQRARVRAGILDPGSRGGLAGPDGILVVGLRGEALRHFNGQSLAAIAAARGQEWPDTLMDLVLAEGPWVAALYVMMCEDNLALQMRQPWIKFSTDAGGLAPDQADHVLVHPRAYGTYPRILGRFVREQGVIPLEDAIRKMTSAVADRLMLHDRGQVREGALADVVIFDPDAIIDHATFTEPHQLSTGVRDVWVNGQRVLADGQHTGRRPGRPVYGRGRR